jgi:hypothetical protein
MNRNREEETRMERKTMGITAEIGKQWIGCFLSQRLPPFGACI